MIVIKVLAEDIALGIPKTVDKCPIALAFRRQFPNCREFTIFSGKVTVDMINYTPVDYNLVQAFISNFDYNRPVSPMEIRYETR